MFAYIEYCFRHLTTFQSYGSLAVFSNCSKEMEKSLKELQKVHLVLKMSKSFEECWLYSADCAIFFMIGKSRMKKGVLYMQCADADCDEILSYLLKY